MLSAEGVGERRGGGAADEGAQAADGDAEAPDEVGVGAGARRHGSGRAAASDPQTATRVSAQSTLKA